MTLPLTDAQAEELLDRYNPSESLRKHGRAVRGMMRHFAGVYGEDVDYWGQVGLLHEIDYEQWPDEHCHKTPELLREAGYDDAFVRAVVSHGWPVCSDEKPELVMEKVLFACDELCGLVTAAVLMRPDKSVMTIEVKSVRKKFKSKGFAAGVDRDIISQGAEMLGVELDALIEGTIAGMRDVAGESGLAGETS
jgi:predicted hydrolase (HD superfamily)